MYGLLHWGRTDSSLSLPLGNGPESGVVPLASARNSLATPVRVTTNPGCLVGGFGKQKTKEVNTDREGGIQRRLLSRATPSHLQASPLTLWKFWTYWPLSFRTHSQGGEVVHVPWAGHFLLYQPRHSRLAGEGTPSLCIARTQHKRWQWRVLRWGQRQGPLLMVGATFQLHWLLTVCLSLAAPGQQGANPPYLSCEART